MGDHKFIYSTIDKIARKTSVFLSKPLIKAIKHFIDMNATWYYRRQFNKCGDNLFVEYPAWIQGCDKMQIGKDVYIFGRIRLEAFSKHIGNVYEPYIEIGDGVSINYDCHICCVNKVVIKKNVLIASKVFITDHFHGKIDSENLTIPPSFRKVQSKGPVIIEENVWIGENVAVMPNVTIGKNSIIGANTVVTSDIPPNSVAVGNPARVIRQL